MNLLDVIRAVLDESVGTGGALANCRRELDRRYEVERTVAQLRARLDASASEREGAAPDQRHHRPAS